MVSLTAPKPFVIKKPKQVWKVSRKLTAANLWLLVKGMIIIAHQPFATIQ